MCICRPSLPIYPSSSLPPWKQYVCFLHLWLYCIYKFICTKCPILIWLISGLSEAINVSCVVFSVLFPLISVSVMFPSPLSLFALFSQVSDNLWCLRMLRAGGSKMAGHLSVSQASPRPGCSTGEAAEAESMSFFLDEDSSLPPEGGRVHSP